MQERRSSNTQTVIAASMAFSALVGAVTGALSAVFVTSLVRSSSLLGSVAADGASSLVAGDGLRALQDDEQTTVSVVGHLAPSVVSVVIKRPEKPGSDVLVDIGGGTGLIVSDNGYIVTNRHVVSEAGATFSVVTNDGTELPATVVSRDPVLDIAVLKVDGSGYPVAVLGDSSAVRIGQTVIAVGNTLSAFRNTVTKGVVSGINRTVLAGDARVPGDTIENAIQTDAAINPGNSGGPLVNLRGEVIGINTAMSFDGQSVGFALPANEVKRDIADVERYGRIVRPWLGVRYGMIDEDFAARRKLPVTRGALVGGSGDGSGAASGGPAEEAGIKDGDIITAVNGKPLGEDLSLSRAIADLLPGDTVTLAVVRGEKTLTLEAKLREYPTNPTP